jgi:hypothetical protein
VAFALLAQAVLSGPAARRRQAVPALRIHGSVPGARIMRRARSPFHQSENKVQDARPAGMSKR